jgi:long-chain fatty acid transport protein
MFTQVFASGYRMEFQSASVLGDAGEAAVVEDAGTNWYNSAGLVYLPQQLVFSAIDVYAPVQFRGTALAPSPFGPPFGYSATGTASSHPNSVIPAFHYSLPFGCNNYGFGLTVAPAWGFTENYGNSSIVRYVLTRVYTKTMDIAPSFAIKVRPKWSIGIGPDFHYFSVLSRSHVYTQGPVIFGGTFNDSISRFSADRWGIGGHIGILFRMNDQTRIGLNYRSKIMMNLKGHSDFLLDNVGVFETHNFKLPIPLPPSTTFSIYHDFTPCFALMGTIAFDEWSVLRDYHARNVAQPLGVIPDVVIPQEMRNTVDVSIGAHYQMLDKLMLRGSIKYEPTPTRSTFRNINFPDARKLGFQIGSRYFINKCLAVDLLYGHVFTNTVTVNDINPLSFASAKGHSQTTIDLLGAQLVWTI